MLGIGMFEVLLLAVVVLACGALVGMLAVVLRRPRPPAGGSYAALESPSEAAPLSADVAWEQAQDIRRRASTEAAEILSRAESEAAELRAGGEADAAELRSGAEADAAGLRQRAEADAGEARRRAEVAARHALDARDDVEAEVRLLKKDKDTRAIISADQSLNYGRVMGLIDVVKGQGIAKFALNIQKGVTAAIPAGGAP